MHKSCLQKEIEARKAKRRNNKEKEEAELAEAKEKGKIQLLVGILAIFVCGVLIILLPNIYISTIKLQALGGMDVRIWGIIVGVVMILISFFWLIYGYLGGIFKGIYRW